MPDLNSTLDKSGSGERPLHYAGENELKAAEQLGAGMDDAQPEAPVLSLEAQQGLVDLVMGCLKAESFARKQEVMEARRERYYERGDQNLYYDKSASLFRPIAESGLELPSYTDVYNIFRPNLRTLVSVLSQNTPGINFVPNDLKSAADISSAALAEKMRHKLYRDVDMAVIQAEAARLFCTDSRVVAWVRAEGDETLVTLHGVLESKVPIYLKGGISKWPYLVLSEEIDLDSAKDQYPDADIEGVKDTAAADTSYERYARLGVLSGTKSKGTGDALKDLTTRHTAWIRPSRYRKLKPDVRPEVEQAFPSGVRVVVCGQEFCEAIESGMDGLHVTFPSPGDGQNRPSLLRDLVPLQDAFNDGMNQVREYFDYGIPATWYNAEVVDSEAISVQKAEPAAMHPANWSPGSGPLSDAFFQEAPAILPAGLMEYLQTIQGSLSQFITGNFPSLYGAEAPSLETMGAYSMAHDSAMGNLSPAWGAMQRFFANITKSGVLVMAQTIGDQDIAVEGRNGTTDSFRASDLLAGDFGCYPDSDSTFPETTASKRAAYTAFVSQVAQFEGGGEIVGQPDNLKLGLQLGGLEDFVVPGAEARDKQLREIEELLKSAPKMPLPDPTQPPPPPGQPPSPPQPQPSVQVDEDYDYHQPEWDKCQQWMSSEERMREEQKGNVQGIENVRLHGLQHKAILDKQAAAAAQQQQAIDNPPPVQKPPTVAIAYKDVADPNAKAQILAEAGIQVSPDAIEEQQGMESAQDALPHILAHQTAARKDLLNVAQATKSEQT